MAVTYATTKVTMNIKAIYGINFFVVGPIDFSPAIWLAIYNVPANGGVTIPTAMFMIINTPTATVLIPRDFVIGIIIGHVRSMIDVGSITHPNANSNILIIVKIANLLLKPAKTAAEILCANPLLDTNQAIAVAKQTIVSIELILILISHMLFQICFHVNVL